MFGGSVPTVRLAFIALASGGCLFAPDRPTGGATDGGPDAAPLSCDVIGGATLNVATIGDRKGLTALVRGGERDGRSIVTLHEPGPTFSTKCPTALIELPDAGRVRALATRADSNADLVYVLSDDRSGPGVVVHILEAREGTLSVRPETLRASMGLTQIATGSGPELPAFITSVSRGAAVEVVFGGGRLFRGVPGSAEMAGLFTSSVLTAQRWYTGAELALDASDLVLMTQPVVARVTGAPPSDSAEPMPSDGTCDLGASGCAGLVARNVPSSSGAVAYTLTRVADAFLLHLVAVYDATAGAKRGTAVLADPAAIRVLDVVLDHHDGSMRDEAFVLADGVTERALYAYPGAVSPDASPMGDAVVVHSSERPVPATSTHLISGSFVPDGLRRLYVLADHPDRDQAEPCFTGTGVDTCDRN